VKLRGILALPAVLALASAAATTGVAAQSSPSAEPGATTAPVAGKCNGEHVKYELSFIPNVQHAGFLVAAAQGYYEDEGLDVEFVAGGPAVDPVQDLPAGAADMAQIDYVALVQARQQGVPIVAIAQNYKDPFFFWYAFKDSGIDTLADWKGQKVGQIQQAGQYPERDAMLIANGLQATDVVPFQQEFGVDPKFGQPDGFPIAEGVVFYHPALLNNPTFPIPGHDSHAFPDDFNVFRPEELGAKMASQTTAVSEEYAAAHPDVIQCFLRASVRGWQKTFMDPQAAVIDTMTFVPPGAIPVEAEQVAINDVLPIVGTGADDPSLLAPTPDEYAATIALLQSLGVLPADATADGTYDDSFYNNMGPVAPVPSSAPGTPPAEPAASGSTAP
jgi:NitT/TauT family transport system substrate-binding protein